MFGWILKTNWDIEKVAEYYKEHEHQMQVPTPH